MKHQYMTCDKCSRVIEGSRGSVQSTLFNSRHEHVKTRIYDLCLDCQNSLNIYLDMKRPVPVQEA